MDEIDREMLRRKLRAVLLLRAKAKAKGTTYAHELLAFRDELREIIKKEDNPKEVLTTKESEIDPDQNMDQQLGVVLEGAMRYQEGSKKT
jgi:hypothetical protein